MPVAQLAISCVLEGIGAAFGELYGRKLLSCLRLGPTQATYFLSHGETDKGHAEEIGGVIMGCDLTPVGMVVDGARRSDRRAALSGLYSHEAFDGIRRNQ
jgi:hypothetical protein